MSLRLFSRLNAMVRLIVGCAVIAAGSLAVQAEPTPAPDHSLTLREYLDAGVTAITPDQTFDSEVLEIDGFLLRAQLAVGETTDEWIGLEPPDAKTAEGAQIYDNLLAMQAGFTKSALGSLEFMMDRTYIRTSEAARFAGELQGVLPTMMNFLDEPAKNQLREPIKEAISKDKDPALKTALVNLLSAMK